MTALLLLSLWAAAPASPPPLPQGEAVARVLSVRNVASVVRAGVTFAATPELPLARTDTLEVAPDGLLLVLVLKNDRVVRLEDDLRLKVSELAVLDAPKAPSGVEAQLQELLTPRELKERANRTAGWLVGAAAATVPSARQEAKKEASRTFGADSYGPPGRGGGTAAPPPAPAAAPAAAARAATPASPPAPSRALTESDEAARPAPATQREEASPAKSAEALSPPKAPQEVPPEAELRVRQAPLADKKLSQCVDAYLAGLPGVRQRYGKALQLQYRFTADGVLVRLERGLPPPRCARELLGKQPKPAGPAGGWQTLTVPLK